MFDGGRKILKIDNCFGKQAAGIAISYYQSYTIYQLARKSVKKTLKQNKVP